MDLTKDDILMKKINNLSQWVGIVFGVHDIVGHFA